MIIQSFIKGQEYGLDIFNDFSKATKSVFIKRKIAMRAGETDQAISIKNDSLLTLAKKLGNNLKHIGPLDVDIILDKKGFPHVIEMNPRFGGGVSSST